MWFSAEELNQLDADFTTSINRAGPASLDWLVNDRCFEGVLEKWDSDLRRVFALTRSVIWFRPGAVICRRGLV